MKGTIKALVRDRKFGFIAREGEAKDLFFHNSQLNGVAFDDLNDGKDGKKATAVIFDVVQGEKGPAAENVSLDPDN